MWSREMSDHTARHFGDTGFLLLKKDMLDVFAADMTGISICLSVLNRLFQRKRETSA